MYKYVFEICLCVCTFEHVFPCWICLRTLYVCVKFVFNNCARAFQAYFLWLHPSLPSADAGTAGIYPPPCLRRVRRVVLHLPENKSGIKNQEISGTLSGTQTGGRLPEVISLTGTRNQKSGKVVKHMVLGQVSGQLLINACRGTLPRAKCRSPWTPPAGPQNLLKKMHWNKCTQKGALEIQNRALEGPQITNLLNTIHKNNPETTSGNKHRSRLKNDTLGH